MKYYKLILIVLILISCKASQSEHKVKIQTEEPIIYIFPETVRKLLAQELKKHDNNIYLCLSTFPEYYLLSIGELNKKNAYAHKTNRLAYVDGTFHPVIFDTDMAFGTLKDSSAVRKIFQNEESAISRQIIILDGYFIKFKADGKILGNRY